MMYKFYSIEETILRLTLLVGNDHLIRVRASDDLEYEFVSREKYRPLHRLRGIQSIHPYLISSVKERGFAVYGYHPEYKEIYSFSPVEEVGLVCFEETELIKNPCSRNPLPTLRFSQNQVCGSYPEYLTHFNLEDTYINRGKVLTLATQLAKVSPKADLGDTHSYDPSLVEKLYYGLSRFGKKVPVLRYQGLSDLFGFTRMVKTFPDITESQIVELFDSYDMPLPSTAQKYIRDLRKEESTSKTRPPRKRSQPIGELDLIQYIGRHHIRYRKGHVWIDSKSLGQERVAKNPFDLVTNIRANGDTIEATLGPKLWEEVTGSKWDDGGDDDE